MFIHYRFFTYFISLWIVLFLSGCDFFSHNLSRSKAESIIKDNIAKEIIMNVDVGDASGTMTFSCREKNCMKEPFLEKRTDANDLIVLRDAGFVTVSVKIWNKQTLYGWWPEFISTYVIRPTSKANSLSKVIINPQDDKKRTLVLKLAELDKLTVTGITEPSDAMGQKIVEAQFTVQYKPTPISDLFHKPSHLTVDSAAIFVKFDDGWRLQETKSNEKSFKELEEIKFVEPEPQEAVQQN